MAWARVDDQWWSHPKVLPLSLAARGLWVSVLSWSCGQRKPTVPVHLVQLLGGDDELAGELADAGLWKRTSSGWEIHQWADYQERSLSELRSDAGKKGAEKRWNSDSKPMANDFATNGKGDGGYPSLPIPIQEPPQTPPTLAAERALILWAELTDTQPTRSWLKRNFDYAADFLRQHPGLDWDRYLRWARTQKCRAPSGWELFWAKWVDEPPPREYADCALCDNRRLVGLLEDGSETTLDDLEATSTRQCRCVKEAK